MKKSKKIILISISALLSIAFLIYFYAQYKGKIEISKNELKKYVDVVVSGTYATKTYNDFIEAQKHANNILKNNFASLKDIDEAKQNLITTLNRLKIAKKIKYRVEFSSKLSKNDSVGNEWSILYKNKSKVIEGKSEIILNLKETPSFKCEITEKDSYPDIGNAEFIFNSETNTIITQVQIIENKGRYKGNKASWEIKCTIIPIEYL